ncbi:MAG: hypothetical protein IE909_04685 [Campylobacterales bacterium]|nr:hypothetical protein [Campylobacterales bacterium]
MVVHKDKIKSEALLLICKDMIITYKQKEVLQGQMQGVDQQTKEFVITRTEHFLKAINVCVQPIDYYLRNKRVSRIVMILKSYQYLHDALSKKFSKNQQFNPFMLCIAMISTWFVELEKCNNEKEYLYFERYPYGEIFDGIFVKNQHIEYKKLSIAMVEIAESVITKFDNFRF